MTTTNYNLETINYAFMVIQESEDEVVSIEPHLRRVQNHNETESIPMDVLGVCVQGRPVIGEHVNIANR
jgi:hypothetical protein